MSTPANRRFKNDHVYIRLLAKSQPEIRSSHSITAKSLKASAFISIPVPGISSRRLMLPATGSGSPSKMYQKSSLPISTRFASSVPVTPAEAGTQLVRLLPRHARWIPTSRGGSQSGQRSLANSASFNLVANLLPYMVDYLLLWLSNHPKID